MTIALLRNVHRNLGDEAMLAAEIALLRRRFPAAHLHLLTDEPAQAGPRYAVAASHSDVVLVNPWRGASTAVWEQSALGWPGGPWLRRMRNRLQVPWLIRRFLRHVATGRPRLPASQLALLQALRGADIVVAGGGLVPTVGHMMMARTAVYRTLAALRRPLVLHGQTVQHRNDPDAPCRLAARLIVRDAGESRRRAESCGMPPADIRDGVDPALSLPLAPPAAVEACLGRLGLAGRSYAVVSLRSGLNDAALASLAGDLRALAAQGRFERVLLAGMQSHPAENDRGAIDRFLQVANGLPSAACLEWPDPGLLKAVIARAALVIACRYHACVFALSTATPVLALSVSDEYDVKLRGILEQFERPQWLVRPGQPLTELAAAAMQPAGREGLGRMAARLAGRAELLADCIEELGGMGGRNE